MLSPHIFTKLNISLLSIECLPWFKNSLENNSNVSNKGTQCIGKDATSLTLCLNITSCLSTSDDDLSISSLFSLCFLSAISLLFFFFIVFFVTWYDLPPLKKSCIDLLVNFVFVVFFFVELDFFLPSKALLPFLNFSKVLMFLNAWVALIETRFSLANVTLIWRG